MRPKIKTKKTKAVYHSGITLSGLSEKDIDKIKRDLTFDNPNYAKTLRYSRYATTNVPPYLTYYTSNKAGITVPVGYDISSLNIDSVEDNRVHKHIETSPFKLTLRGSQKEASDNYLELNKQDTLKGSIQLPTGKGKSILGLYISSYLSTKTLIIVHKDDLVKGWQEDIKLSFDNKVSPGLIKAKSRTIGHFLTIATIQTLNKLPEKELQELYNTFGLVILDEMHHCGASSFDMVDKFNARYKLGLTATPERSDGLTQVMSLYFGEFCYTYKRGKDEDEKDILPVEVKIRKHNLYINPVCKKVNRNGKERYVLHDLVTPENTKLKKNQMRLSDISYTERPQVQFQKLDDIMVRNIYDLVVPDIVSEYKKGHSCIVFFTQKEHCRLYFDYLKEFIPEKDIGMYYGDNKENDTVKAKAEKQRKFVTLTTFAKSTEGTNVKQWEVEFLVSSSNNEKNTEQAVGRIRRSKEGCKLDTVLVYDYRTPYVHSISSHGKTRDKRYAKLGFKVDGVKRTMFSRGY